MEPTDLKKATQPDEARDDRTQLVMRWSAGADGRLTCQWVSPLAKSDDLFLAS